MADNGRAGRSVLGSVRSGVSKASKMPHPWNDNVHGWENPTTSRAGTISYPSNKGVEGPAVNQNKKRVEATVSTYIKQRRAAGTRGY